MEKSPTDIASVSHWDSVWTDTPSVRGFSSLNYYDFRLAQLFQDHMRPGGRVLEIGCGGSRWIQFFADSMKCETWGIDYSGAGLKITAQNNSGSSNVHLVQGDFFDESLLPLDHFDLIYSLGFIEHFTETAVVTRRIANLLRPGGKVMTLIPNFAGPYGALQRRVNRPTFEKHVVMVPDQLDQAHVVAGLQPLKSADYFGCFGPGVVDYGAWQRVVLPPLKLFQHLLCWTLHGVHFDHESSSRSPYIVGVYQKPIQR